MSINPPPTVGNGLVNALEMALKRDSIVRAVWSVGGVAKRLEAWLAEQVFTALTVGTLTATDIDTGSLDATGAITTDTLEAATSIETVDLVVTGTATLPGGGGTTYSVSSSAQALNTNGDTIALPADTTVIRVTTPGGITGILIAAGVNGQHIIIVNDSGNAFQYAGASLAEGAVFSHTARLGVWFVYLTSDNKWHRQMT